jgi:AcrR family transcriptional regulator
MAARAIPADRLSTVVDTAAQVFIRHGYRRTQMQDVADELRLAKGTLYLYAGGKEALFAAALRYADGGETVPDTNLPLPAPAPGELAELLAGRLAAELPDLALTRALETTSRPATPAEAASELSHILVDLYQRLARHRVAIKLVDRCAAELPELGSVWQDSGRGAPASWRSRGRCRSRRVQQWSCVSSGLSTATSTKRHLKARSTTKRSPPPWRRWSRGR